MDGAGSADEHVFEFDLITGPNDGQFDNLNKPYTGVLFTQGAFGCMQGDTLNHAGLNQTQVWNAITLPTG